MTFSTKEGLKQTLQQTPGHKSAVFHVEEWGTDIGLRTLNSRERFAYEKSIVKKEGIEGVSEDYQAKLVFLTAVDESGKRLFNDEEDFALLCDQPAHVISKVYLKAQEVNAISKESAEKLEKNSETTGKEGSASDSPSA